MKNIAILTLIILFITTACNENKDYIITGDLGSNLFNGKTAYLRIPNTTGKGDTTLDSVCIENGGYKFKGVCSDTLFAGIVEIESVGTAKIILEKGEIAVKYDSASIKVSGTPENDRLQNFMASLYGYFSEARDNFKNFEIYLEKNKLTPEARNEFVGGQDASMIKMSNLVSDYIKPIAMTPAGQYFLLDNYPYLEPGRFRELFKETSPLFQNSEKGKSFFDAAEKSLATSAGKPYIDVQGVNINGDKVSLSDLIGNAKVVYIDFWASWCGPCIATLPNVKDLYAKYKSKGLVIISISLDEDKGAWLKATKKYGVVWEQLSDLEGWEGSVAKAYGIKYIPQTILIDGNGIIVERGSSSVYPAGKIEELLKQ
ncbi:thiol-disulfide isomerase/thioredoxin [Dysgonomonas sp. PH5-45]|uniref:TlpA disulfide reductase family protein n=1 Tax=unclassified Dysgonomonas TaxID=2630389 RepID=UPI002474AF5E|nr:MULTISPECIES: TlpA disulfide reductase family protein [unclassified Dysgonomonas]MDH6354664.1 thiol-disulfide isomerase/thioredoxin [Dysgonomonas sp. PH5-45]MDH6387561.1 thiol-disulfide isomerase/thioredoxin [Dysgonomonas sp. PH5-37]